MVHPLLRDAPDAGSRLAVHHRTDGHHVSCGRVRSAEALQVSSSPFCFEWSGSRVGDLFFFEL